MFEIKMFTYISSLVDFNTRAMLRDSFALVQVIRYITLVELQVNE